MGASPAKWAFIVTGCVAFACGGSSGPPTSPPPPSGFSLEGTYELNAFTVPTSNIGECPVIQSPGAYPLVSVQMNFQRVGTEWIGRSPSPNSETLEVRLRDGGLTTSRTGRLTGEATGSAIDTLSGGLGDPIRAIFTGVNGASAATIEGDYYLPLASAVGDIIGSIRFEGSSGAASLCEKLRMILRPHRPGF